MADKITLTKEDIQAIAQELAKHTNNASACAKNKTSGKSTEGGKVNNNNTRSEAQKIKSVGKWGIILVWVIVLIALVIKLAPYL